MASQNTTAYEELDPNFYTNKIVKMTVLMRSIYGMIKTLDKFQVVVEQVILKLWTQQE